MSRPSQEEKRIEYHKKLDNSFRLFARKVLQIKTKDGTMCPFVFNDAQEYLHKKLEEQLNSLGRVRALVLKGRQQGCSTYIGGRFYHKAVRQKNKNVFILSHEAETTKKLFKMVERYQENAPADVRPEAKVANRREYEFKDIGSEYAVGTAGNQDVGRGGTVQLFHGSEAAFWEKTDGLETGILQSIADVPGTEIILESTANGMGNMFYQKCMAALEGKGDYQLIFIPWYWQSEYRREIPSDGDTELTEEEREYMRLYDLDVDQIYWRRAKTMEFGKGDIEQGQWKFKQEYPAFVQEAFQTSGDTLISPEAIMRARKSEVKDKDSPLIMGVDPARNKDRTVFAYRRGREILPPEIMVFGDEDNVQMQIAGKLAQRIDTMNPQKVFIDVGHGYGVIDRLRELGYGGIVEGIHFGSKASQEDVFLNKRVEMWCELRDWFHGEDGEVSIPDRDDLQMDLMTMPGEKVTSSGKVKLEPKETIRKNFGISPDIGDAISLTFAYPVKRIIGGEALQNKFKKRNKGGQSPLTTLRRLGRYNKVSGSTTNYYWGK